MIEHYHSRIIILQDPIFSFDSVKSLFYYYQEKVWFMLTTFPRVPAKSIVYKNRVRVKFTVGISIFYFIKKSTFDLVFTLCHLIKCIMNVAFIPIDLYLLIFVCTVQIIQGKYLMLGIFISLLHCIGRWCNIIILMNWSSLRFPETWTCYRPHNQFISILLSLYT